jgi:hypothetical protein
MLLSTTGGDHRTTAKGGGIDLMSVRARLTQVGGWVLTATNPSVFLRNPANALEWGTYTAIYDQFKVNGMKITYCFPKYTACSSVLTTSFLIYPEVVTMIYDNDSIIAPGTLGATLGYSTAKVAACDGLVSYNLPTLPKGATYGASALGYINASEWQDCATPGALAGCITAWLNKQPTCTAGASFAIHVLVEWDITFKGKRN